MKPGTVLFHKDFVFHDGAVKDKYVVVLTDGSSGAYIVACTTSQEKYKQRVRGCQTADRIHNYYLPDGCWAIKGETWILFNHFYSIPCADIVKKNTTGDVNIKDCFAANIISDIILCAVESEDIAGILFDELLEVNDKILGR